MLKLFLFPSIPVRDGNLAVQRPFLTATQKSSHDFVHKKNLAT